MKKMIIVFLLVFITAPSFAHRARWDDFAQTNSAHKLPKTFSKTELWMKTDKVGPHIYGRHEYEYSDSMSLKHFIRIMKGVENYGIYNDAQCWAEKNYVQAFPYLIDMLTDTTTVGLTNTADLIIPGRNLPFYGHGGVSQEDLFTVCGRASHILNDLTGESFAVVHPGTSPKELKKFQRLWTDWIGKLQIN